ncbi:hypothetical protein AB0E63_03665 [Kribbella sp. NPDC026596]|uniref:hypothetical protein n=1 Tax=Kribbella sp. NPDC026596 TaxID=3155122 RepID=UPI0033FDEA3A
MTHIRRHELPKTALNVVLLLIAFAPPVPRLFGEPQGRPHLPDRGVDVAQLAQADAAGPVSDRRGELRRSAPEEQWRAGNRLMRE